MITIETAIGILSIVLNAIFAWLWYRKKEILQTIQDYELAHKDGIITPEERLQLLEAIGRVIDKKSA
ncbi:MAG: hypothetical protein WA144_15395 [Candidatus Methanoperedens sp.]